jgi:hypothetical protein
MMKSALLGLWCFRKPLNVIASEAKIPWGVDSGRV